MTSGRHGGGVARTVSPSTATSQPTDSRWATTVPASIGRPETRAGRSVAMVTCGWAGGVPTTVTPGSAVAPPYVVRSSTTRSAAASQIVGSTPRSLRLPASEVILWRRPVRNIETASQCADSTSTRVVVEEISVDSPPMTPPSPIGPVSSQTTRSSAVRVRTVLSRVVTFSPSTARRTTTGPRSLSAS